MEVPVPGIEPEPQLWQPQILNPLHRAGDQTCTSAATWAAAVRFLTHCTMTGTPWVHFWGPGSGDTRITKTVSALGWLKVSWGRQFQHFFSEVWGWVEEVVGQVTDCVWALGVVVVVIFRNKWQAEDSSLHESLPSHSRREKKEERGPTWAGWDFPCGLEWLWDLARLVKGLSGEEEHLGSQRTTESALRAGRALKRSPGPGRLPLQPTCLHILHLSSRLLCSTSWTSNLACGPLPVLPVLLGSPLLGRF